MTDDSPVYHTLSVHLCCAKMIARFDNRSAIAKFYMSLVWSTVPDEVPLFWRYPNFLTTQCRTGGRKSRAKKQPDLFSQFNRTLTRDRQTHSHSKYPCQHSVVRVKNQHLTQTTSRSRAKCGVVLVHIIIQAVSKFRAIFLSI